MHWMEFIKLLHIGSVVLLVYLLSVHVYSFWDFIFYILEHPQRGVLGFYILDFRTSPKGKGGTILRKIRSRTEHLSVVAMKINWNWP